MYVCMHTITTGEELSHEFEGDWGGIYGGVWREEREGRKVIILY